MKLSIIYGKRHRDRLLARVEHVGIIECSIEIKALNSEYEETTWINVYPDISIRAVRALEMLKNSPIGGVSECNAPTWNNRYRTGIVKDITFEANIPGQLNTVRSRYGKAKTERMTW